MSFPSSPVMVVVVVVTPSAAGTASPNALSTAPTTSSFIVAKARLSSSDESMVSGAVGGVAPPHRRPTRIGDAARQVRLVGPCPDRLGQIHICIGIRRHRRGDPRQSLHQVLLVDG